jgi:hypothetical protein
MKHILGCGLLVMAVAFCAQASAADEGLCSANIQRLNDRVNSAGTTDPEIKKLVDKDIHRAQAAKDKGHIKTCIDITTKSMTKLNNYHK